MKINNHMQQYTILKGIGQVILMRTLKRYLQSVDAVATTTPIPPRPSLARCSQDHRFYIQNIPPKTISLIPQICPSLLHGNSSLYRICRLSHHGEDLSSDPLKLDLQDI
jgi:hypothetical protein